MEELVMIHQDLKEILDKEGLKGCTYIPVEKYQSGLSYYFESMKQL
jgi:hypothetical protein